MVMLLESQRSLADFGADRLKKQQQQLSTLCQKAQSFVQSCGIILHKF